MKALSLPSAALGRFYRSIRLLYRSMRPTHNELLLPETYSTAEGFEYDVYLPRTKPIRTVMMIYGMTIGGKQDVRVMKFARSCANAGLRVIVPYLPGLMGFVFEFGDMQRLESIAKRVASESSEKISLIGFSTGGSYSLLLAGRPALTEKIGPVVLFSPIYDAREVAEHLHAPVDRLPSSGRELDWFIWSQFVIAYRNRNLLGLSDAVQEALQTMLADYDAFDLDVKRVFHQNHVAGLDLIHHGSLLHEGTTLDLLSARGHLAQVLSPVFILHDVADQVVPPDQSRRMHAELTRRGAAFHQEVLITPWLSHVVMQTSGSLGELFRIIGFLAELFKTT